jgi:hypothetical protein
MPLALKLKSVNEKGSSIYSAELTTVIGEKPDPPTLLKLESRESKTSIRISWTADVLKTDNQPTLGYRVYKLNANIDDTLLYTTKSGSLSTSAVIDNLRASESIDLEVRAYNMYGESSGSNTLTLIVGLKPVIPPTPSVSTSTSVSITIQVEPSQDNGGSPITSYTVYYDVGQTGIFTSVALTDLWDLQLPLSSLPSGSLVDVQVTATNAIDESDKSNLSKSISNIHFIVTFT